MNKPMIKKRKIDDKENHSFYDPNFSNIGADDVLKDPDYIPLNPKKKRKLSPIKMFHKMQQSPLVSAVLDK